MTDKFHIDLYDETKISPAAKRLALCFNLAAETYGKDSSYSGTEILLENGKELFVATTQPDIPVFNKDEASFMREQFLKIAAKQQTKDSGWQPYPEAIAEKMETIERAAKAIGLKI